MTPKTGRPKKATTEEKIAIVNRYYISNTDGSALQIRSHGIFRKLADFSRTCNFPLEPHDFSRDKGVRDYIDHLASTSQREVQESKAVPAYEPLDITALMTTGRSNIEKTLRDREAYFESLHIRSSRAIENYSLISQKCTRLQAEVETTKSENDALKEENAVLAKKLRDALKDIVYLKRIIRRDVEPDRAQQFFASMTTQEIAVQQAKDSVMNNINILTREDRKMRTEADNEIDMLDLNSLFK